MLIFDLEASQRWIPGYEGRYSITDNGIVYSYIGKGRIKATRVDCKGYVVVNLSGNGTYRNAKVHRLVVQSWGEWDPDLQVNHKDGNKLNNHIDNLEMVTARENTQHAYNTGIITPRKGVNVKNHILNEELVKLIRVMYSDGIPQREIARRLGVSHYPIWYVVHGKTWRHV